MSIFWIGGPEGVIVPEDEINATEEDRYFMPGIIHGSEDYIIQVYYWSNGEGPAGDRIGAKYLWAASVLEWVKEAESEDGSFNHAVFEELINNYAEEFVLENDGTGDFVTLNTVWDQALPLSYSDVIKWANEQISKERRDGDHKLPLEEQIQHASDRASGQETALEQKAAVPEH